MSPPEPPAELSLMNTDLCNKMCELFAEKLRSELNISLNNIVETLKTDFIEEIGKHDVEIIALKSENLVLRDKLGSACARISTLEANIVDISAAITILNDSPPSASPIRVPPKVHSLDTVIAGDSVVKHWDVQEFAGDKNKLICLPGARAEKVVSAVKDLASDTDIKNLVVHFGTNNIFHKSKQSPLDIANEIEESLKQLKRDLPNSKIHFSAILPKIDMSFTRSIEFINWKTWQLCKKLGLGFIEHPTFVQRGDLNQRLFSPSEWKDWRPIHPSHEGVRMLQTNIKLHLC